MSRKQLLFYHCLNLKWYRYSKKLTDFIRCNVHTHTHTHTIWTMRNFIKTYNYIRCSGKISISYPVRWTGLKCTIFPNRKRSSDFSILFFMSLRTGGCIYSVYCTEKRRYYLHISKSLNEHNKNSNRRPIKCCHVVFYIKPDISVKIKQK